MSKPKVSVIVGCYNVIKWLKSGRLSNIYNQTYPNWELILVDDGSTDATLEFLNKESQKDPRIRVLHKENGGLGSARNLGLDVATGDYICSFDVDDEIEPDMLEYCVSTMEQKQVDVMMFGFYAKTPHLGTKEVVQLKETVICNQQELAENYVERILLIPNGNGFFWNKCYRKTFLDKNGLRFENQYIQQDEFFNLKVYEVLNRCYISNRILYHYYIYNTGNNRSRFIPTRFDIYKSIYNQFRNLQKTLNITDSRFDDYLCKRFYDGVMSCMLFNLTHPNCTFSKSQKKEEMARIMTDQFTIEAFSYADKAYSGLEQRLYREACRHQSIWQILLLVNSFSFFRNIYSKICN